MAHSEIQPSFVEWEKSLGLYWRPWQHGWKTLITTLSAQCCHGSLLFRIGSHCPSLVVPHDLPFFLQSFSFFSMGSLQDSPFYKHDWLPSTTSERKLQTTFSSLVQVSLFTPPLCSIWCSPPHTPGNTPYLAPHATLSPFCTCPMEATLAKSYSIFCLFTAKFFKALLTPAFSLYTLWAGSSCFTDHIFDVSVHITCLSSELA